jgi:hypothetical protein
MVPEPAVVEVIPVIATVAPTLEVIPVIVALLNATGEIMRGFAELPIPKEAAVQRPTVLSTTMFVAEVDVDAVVTAD